VLAGLLNHPAPTEAEAGLGCYSQVSGYQIGYLMSSTMRPTRAVTHPRRSVVN
jgi:hypothetical protein